MKTKRIKLEKNKLDGTKTGISIDLSSNTKMLFEVGGKTRTRISTPAADVAPRVDAEGELARRIRDILCEPAIHMSKDLWKRLGENSTMVYSKRPKVSGDAELTFYSKDKTHALLLESNVPDGKLTQKQAYLFAHQLARVMADSELPLATATIVFFVPEGAPVYQKLLTVFHDGYSVPTVNMSGALLSSVKLSSRGARQAKNIVRFPMALTYKSEKISLQVTVKIVEFPAQLFLS